MDESQNLEGFEAWAKIAPLLSGPYQDVVGFQDKSAEEQLAFFAELGVSLADLESMLPYLKEAPERVPPELLTIATQAVRECALGWTPTVLHPAAFTYSENRVHDHAQELVRIYYPTMDSSSRIPDGMFLSGCGRYPLVIFLHGHCSRELNQYRKWSRLCGQLARSGFVVVAPQLPNISRGGSPDSDLALAQQVVSWMRNGVYAGSLLPRTAVVGHSYGAILGARLANEISAAAFVSLSGGWGEWPEESVWEPLFRLNMPKFFTWGTGNDAPSDLDIRPQIWNRISGPKHKVAFTGAGHWEYLNPSSTRCGEIEGPCQRVRYLAADFAALFLARYVPNFPTLPLAIGDNLRLPVVPRTPEQKRYAAGHLLGLTRLNSSPGCRPLTHAWVRRNGEAHSVQV